MEFVIESNNCLVCKKECSQYRFCYKCNPKFKQQQTEQNNQCLICKKACKSSYRYCFICNRNRNKNN